MVFSAQNLSRKFDPDAPGGQKLGVGTEVRGKRFPVVARHL